MKSKELSIGESELLLISELKRGVEISYTPGKTPLVVDKARGREIRNLLLKAENKGIPIVEQPALDDRIYRQLKLREEIPLAFYRPAARALAAIYRASSSPQIIRVIKIKGGKKPPQLELAKQTTAELAPWLEISEVSVELAPENFKELRESLKSALDQMRQRIVLELGLNLSPIVLRSNPHLQPDHFLFKLREVVVEDGKIPEGKAKGEKLLFLSNHLKNLLGKNAAELLSFYQVEALMENLKKQRAGLLRDLYPLPLSVAVMRNILRNLLREEISIRDLEKIMEVLKDSLAQSSDPELLTEFVRAAFSVYLCRKHQDDKGQLNVLLVSPQLEEEILSALRETANLIWLELSPEQGLKILTQVDGELKKAKAVGIEPVVLCSPHLRRFFRRLLEGTFPSLAVLSFSEIAPLTPVKTVGIIQL